MRATNDFSEFFQYDPNGNILSADRSASLEGAGGLNMDVLTYQYENNSNKLSHVTDLVPSSTHDYDVDGQSALNYTYDQIGNLVADAQENITDITWSVYGKIYSITKINTPANKQTLTQYSYDPSGNRITKLVTQSAIGGGAPVITDRTLYVRDAQGNVMATYSKHEEAGQTPALLWAEQHLYGSSRLGVMNLQMEIPAQPMVPLDGQTLEDSLHTGQYAYELTNHLGNVMATISDKKLFSNLTDPEGGTEPIYSAELLSQTDYYAFGQEIKDRSYRLNGPYRYGFNGKENDNEIKGEGNQQDYGMRIYDPRLGKFLSVDPLTKSYPAISPYPFAMNRPIDGIDLDGLEWIHFNVRFSKTSEGKIIVLDKKVVQDFRNLSEKELNTIHKTTSFYTKYSKGFGPKGAGVLFTYQEVDFRGNIISEREDMEVVSGLTRHGFYAGSGCVTKNGELITPGKFGNYDFGMMPIDMSDAIAKMHDKLQDIPLYKGHSHQDYLNSDLIFLAMLKRFKGEYEKNLNYKDPFTGRKVSSDQKKFVENAISLFTMFVMDKVNKLNEDLQNGKIDKSEYEKKMDLYNHQNAIEFLALPAPNDKLNKGGK